MEEIWKPIQGYENYMVSSLGRVKSLGNGGNNQYTNKQIILKPHETKKGYLQVCLYNNEVKTRKRFLIHVLVANTFLENPENLPQVNHKDENKQNNCMSNLEFCDGKYNMQYSRGVKIKCLDLETNEILFFSAIREAARHFNTGKSSILNSLKHNKSPYKNRYIFEEIKRARN